MKRLVFGLFSCFILSSVPLAQAADKAPGKLKISGKEHSKPVIKTASEEFKSEFLYRINKLRAEGCNCGDEFMPPVTPLTWNEQLELAAYGHAQDMFLKRYFDHISKDGSKLRDRIFATGYTYNGYKSFFIGENIAMGQRSIGEVMDGWISSEGHCRNLMNPNFKEVGIALVKSYWVQDFGARNPFERKKGIW